MYPDDGFSDSQDHQQVIYSLIHRSLFSNPTLKCSYPLPSTVVSLSVLDSSWTFFTKSSSSICLMLALYFLLCLLFSSSLVADGFWSLSDSFKTSGRRCILEEFLRFLGSNVGSSTASVEYRALLTIFRFVSIRILITDEVYLI